MHPAAEQRWWRVLREVLAVAIPVVVVLASSDGPASRWLAGLFGCAALPLRHRWPTVTLVLCLPGLVGGLGWAPAVVSMFTFGRCRPGFWPLAVAIPVVSTTAVAPVLLTESLGPRQQLLTMVFALFAVSTPMALGMLISTRRRLAESLDRLRDETEAKLRARAETARAEERAQIAREIHDAVGHHVTLITVEAAALAATSPDPDTREVATRVRGTAKTALQEMRTTLGLVTADQAQPANLGAVPELVRRTQAAGVDVRLVDELDDQVSPTPDVGRAAYRAVQEALTNASKHAPESGVTVRLQQDAENLWITVHNTVPAAHPALDSGGTGLQGLSERVRMAGGRLDAGPCEDGGFRLQAVLPCQRP